MSARLSRCSLRRPPYAYLPLACIRSFPIHEKEKRRPDKGGRVVSPRTEIEKVGRGERERRKKKKTKEVPAGTASIFKLAWPYAAARRGWRGTEGARWRSGYSSGPFRICPIENLSDVHGVSNSRRFHRRARACSRLSSLALFPFPSCPRSFIF